MELEENCSKQCSFYVDNKACVRAGNNVSGFRIMLD